ncbi:NUDIX hydrolase [Psychromonas sp. KJ10-10]|uniref:NUDIX hydrolase n=1 Tax=Psychromonas sp. KJ10-10 TaxID=3391823 RepID=UPI0039B45193
MFNYCPICKSEKVNTAQLPLIKCPDCHFTYFHNCASAVVAIICCDNQMLFNVRAQQPALGRLDLPGGFVDYDESLEQALQREVKEELNLDISQWQYFTSQANTYEYKNITYKTTDAFFISHLEKKPEIVLEKTEVADFMWIDIDKVDISKIGFESIRKALSMFIEEYKTTSFE